MPGIGPHIVQPVAQSLQRLHYPGSSLFNIQVYNLILNSSIWHNLSCIIWRACRNYSPRWCPGVDILLMQHMTTSPLGRRHSSGSLLPEWVTLHYPAVGKKKYRFLKLDKNIYIFIRHKRQTEPHSTYFCCLTNGIKYYHWIFSHKFTIFPGMQDEGIPLNLVLKYVKSS